MKNINDDKKQTALFSLSNMWKRYTLRKQLNALDDRLLEDIGLRRHEVSTVVEDSFPHISLRETLVKLLKKVVALRANQQAAWELSGFDDRMLADIGLYRSDISSIAHGNYPERRTKAANDDHQRAA